MRASASEWILWYSHRIDDEWLISLCLGHLEDGGYEGNRPD